MTLLQSGLAKSLAADAYTIDYSCRFYLGWLSKTFAGAGNLDKWTVSCWLKNNGGVTSGSNGLNGILYQQLNNGQKTAIWNHGGGGPDFWNMTSAGDTAGGYRGPSQKIRDPASWYHFVFVWDSGNATAGDRMRIWKNGVRITAFGSSADPPINQDSYINKAAAHQIGYYLAESGGQYYADCYFADYYFLDGQAEDADAFGELKSTTNQWIPKDAVNDLTFGTNGFYLKFQDSSALGDDSSGNNNDFAVNVITATDQMGDTPTNNWCTLNPLDVEVRSSSIEPTFSEGNLKISNDDSSYAGTGYGTIYVEGSGKFYAEFLPLTNLNTTGSMGYPSFGLMQDTAISQRSHGDTGYYAYGPKGLTKAPGGTATSYGNTYTNGDIIGIAYDADNGKVYFSKNGTWQNSGDPTSGATGTGAAFSGVTGNFTCYIESYNAGTAQTTAANFGQDSSFAGEKTAQGNQDSNDKGDFYYTPPTDYLALCTDNLSDPEIALPGEHFNTVLYAGNGAARDITTVFQPDLVWLKNRDDTYNHILQDVVRGFATDTKLSSNDAWASDNANLSSNYGYISAADSDSFSLATTSSWGQVNESGNDFVSWYWKAGGSAVANTTGTIDALVSANTTAGFSIVKFDEAGTGAAATIGHGLSQRPELVIGKPYTHGDNWRVGSDYLASSPDWGEIILLNLGNDAYTKDSVFDGGNYPGGPSASVVYMSTDGLNNTSYYSVLYCFHSVEGYSKVGSYEGNGNADGTFVYTGFRPAFFIIKNIDSDYGWITFDDKRNTYNPEENYLYPNSNAAEDVTTSGMTDFVSNGFKFRGTGVAYNGSETFLYIAFAESPFKTANAR